MSWLSLAYACRLLGEKDAGDLPMVAVTIKDLANFAQGLLLRLFRHPCRIASLLIQ